MSAFQGPQSLACTHRPQVSTCFLNSSRNASGGDKNLIQLIKAYYITAAVDGDVEMESSVGWLQILHPTAGGIYSHHRYFTSLPTKAIQLFMLSHCIVD
jgi:hypothetical protein